MAIAILSASRANSSSVVASSRLVPRVLPVRQASQVPWTCTIVLAGTKPRPDATSEIEVSTSELRNSNDWPQLSQMR